MEDKYYSVKELAKKLNVSCRTIARAIKAKRIFAFRPGCGLKSPWRIHESELLRIMHVDYENTLKNLDVKDD